MKNFEFVGTICLILVIFVILNLLDSSKNNSINLINKEKNKYEINIGKRIILEKDTLSIINFSTFEETYTLSNGLKVNKGIINNGKFID